MYKSFLKLGFSIVDVYADLLKRSNDTISYKKKLSLFLIPLYLIILIYNF